MPNLEEKFKVYANGAGVNKEMFPTGEVFVGTRDTYDEALFFGEETLKYGQGGYISFRIEKVYFEGKPPTKQELAERLANAITSVDRLGSYDGTACLEVKAQSSNDEFNGLLQAFLAAWGTK